MEGYYEDRLSGEALRRCYEIASPRIRRYREAEVEFVVDTVRGARRALELGWGYGRVMREVSASVRLIVGYDTSGPSLTLAKSFMRPCRNFGLARTDAEELAFRSGAFDAVFCIQNGVSAFGVNREQLIAEAVRVTRKGGRILFSTYSSRIWQDRLAWFRAQAGAGPLGEIDEARTAQGTIICKDGF